MDVTIIGTGHMARGIASRALAGGHGVTLIGRREEDARRLAEELGGALRAGAVGDPPAGEVVVLAVPYGAVEDVLAAYPDRLAGRVVVDITNPVDFGSFTQLDLPAGSAAQEIARRAPAARVVKGFNTTFASTLSEGRVAGQALDVLLASDDREAKALVARLVQDGGMRPVDAGPLDRARQLEGLGYLHMAVQESLGTGYGSAVKLVA